MSIGVPIKILHEVRKKTLKVSWKAIDRRILYSFQAEGHIITCETISGEVYRGRLVEAEDNMNCQITSVTVTQRDGKVCQMENIYIRGSKIR